jgi:hypothetical protein
MFSDDLSPNGNVTGLTDNDFESLGTPVNDVKAVILIRMTNGQSLRPAVP